MDNPEIRIIAAVAANGAIGYQNQLPWNIEQEYKHYLELIRDQTVIMGRKTYEIFSKDLTSKRDIVLSKSLHQMEDAIVKQSLRDALEYACGFDEIIYLAGGYNVYNQGLKIADQLYISHIHDSYTGDTYFPTINPRHWQIAESVVYPEFTFTIYTKK